MDSSLHLPQGSHQRKMTATDRLAVQSLQLAPPASRRSLWWLGSQCSVRHPMEWTDQSRIQWKDGQVRLRTDWAYSSRLTALHRNRKPAWIVQRIPLRCYLAGPFQIHCGRFDWSCWWIQRWFRFVLAGRMRFGGRMECSTAWIRRRVLLPYFGLPALAEFYETTNSVQTGLALT